MQNELDFPMSEYVTSWKLFRYLSDENIETANHILNLPLWKQKNPKIIMDAGCGDGLLLKSLILIAEPPIEEVILVDPDPNLLYDAYRNIKETGIVNRINTEQREINSQYFIIPSYVDIILGIHIAYLIDFGVFKRFILNLPKGIPFYLILDNPDSIFSMLWEVTAPKYHERSILTNQLMDDILDQGFSVNYSEVKSRIKNPLSFNKEVSSKLLSILSYSDFTKMNEEHRKYVTNTIQNHIHNNYVICRSACYEIINI